MELFIAVVTAYLVPVTNACETPLAYNGCQKLISDGLNVHVVPHSHLDIGWLKTADEYFSENSDDSVQNIISNVVEELMKDNNKRFFFVETYYIWRWWCRQEDAVKHIVYELVQEGRLQFAGGGWSMNDEATTHYQSIIDQFTWGLYKLNQTFGNCALPRVAWQIDTFGHSAEFASLLASMGYTSLILGRAHNREKEIRKQEITLEFIWRGDEDLGKESDILTSILFNGYCQINDSTNLEALKQIAASYKTRNILIPYGCDFSFGDAKKEFQPIDYAINSVKEFSNEYSRSSEVKVNMFYSTPQCYMKAVEDSEVPLPKRTGDFFPFAEHENVYWSGYFTSKPSIKYFERQGNSYLQMAKQLHVLADLDEINILKLNELRSTMGILQHHDAITGTARNHVTLDYVRRLDGAIEDTLTIVRKALRKYMRTGSARWELDLDRCMLNESSCGTSESSDPFIVTLYNHLGWSVKESIRIPVQNNSYSVYAPDGERIRSQLVEIPAAVITLPSRKSVATHEIVFIAHLQPVSYKSFYIEKLDPSEVDADYDVKTDEKLSLKKETGFENNFNWLAYRKAHTFDLNDVDNKHFVNSKREDKFGFEKAFSEVILNEKRNPNFNVKYFYYGSECVGVSSGAYVFHHNNSEEFIEVTPLYFKGAIGRLVKEIKTIAHTSVSSIIRTYEGQNYIENDWVIGPISTDDEIAKEFIVQYVSLINNKGVFYTDSNGRQMMERKVDISPYWNETDNKDGTKKNETDIPRNYYPVTNKISIQDDTIRMSVLTDRAEGGTSLKDGVIELMLHRRLIKDDDYGDLQVLDETFEGKGLVVRGRHRILLSKVDSYKDLIEEKKQTIQFHLQPQVFLSYAQCCTLDNWFKMRNEYSWANELQTGLHILTLEPWEDDAILLRIENFLEPDDIEITSRQIDLNGIFKSITIVAYREASLAANFWVNEKQYLEVSGENVNFDRVTARLKKPSLTSSLLVIDAKEIKTLVCWIQRTKMDFVLDSSHTEEKDTYRRDDDIISLGIAFDSLAKLVNNCGVLILFKLEFYLSFSCMLSYLMMVNRP